MYLVHFRSRDLTRLHRQGQFWHIFFTHGGVIIAQDELDTWTTHLPVPVEFEQSTMPPEEQIYRVLGGQGDPYEIEVDDILVSSVWRPNNAIADSYCSPHRRVYLAGDAAHQNIPTGGYGMNTGLGDAYDIAWKLALVICGVSGDAMLQSYEAERRPVAIRNVKRAAEHMAVHQHYVARALAAGSDMMLGSSEESKALKTQIANFVNEHDGENKDHGIEMGYRLIGSPVICDEGDTAEPHWSPRVYTPSTRPGNRAPHVLLESSGASVFDQLGAQYTVVDFSETGLLSQRLVQLGRLKGLPIERTHLPDDGNARKVWERDVVLIRPDHFVAWRNDTDGSYTDAQLSSILDKVFGRQLPSTPPLSTRVDGTAQDLSFAGATEVWNQDLVKVDRLAVFQN
ncbi:hypothetical protein LTR53_010015 [Teratosphaeriaceae sp. CCFEE 6253]|nr:hypothetical protein LTR53_010015 [Teratosphaeriaceae sp. CCFEE 6253]